MRKCCRDWELNPWHARITSPFDKGAFLVHFSSRILVGRRRRCRKCLLNRVADILRALGRCSGNPRDRLPGDSQVCSRNTSAVSPWPRLSVHSNSLKPSAEKEVGLLLSQGCVDREGMAGTRAPYRECLCIEKFTGKSCSCRTRALLVTAKF